MTGLVQSETNGSVCHIEMNDGRDNRLSRAMCLELTQNLASAFEAEDVSLILLTGRGAFFSAGYDLSNLSSDADQVALFQLVDLLIRAPKPVIAGIEGDALGAGLELALLCSLRLAAPGVRFGFPDVLHGLPPGAGATQTLPRLLGAERSLDMLISGNVIAAGRLTGVIDAEIQGDFLSGANRFAQSLAAQNLGPISVGDRTEGFADPAAYQNALVDARERLDGAEGAPADILTAVETALLLPFSAGINAEREMFKAAETRATARARRHLIHQRWCLEGANRRDIGTGDQLDRIAILGSGDQGLPGAARLLLAGSAVTLIHGEDVQSEDQRFDVLDVARQEAKIRDLGEIHEARLSDQLTVSSDIADAATADLVLDISGDDLPELRDRAERLGSLLPGHAILAIASQHVDISSVETAFARPTQCAKLWLDADLDQELCAYSVAGENHSATRSLVLRLLQMLGMNGIETKLEAGLAEVTLWLKLLQAAETLSIAGTPVSAIDTALADRGFGEGPFQMADAVGLDAICQLCDDVPGFDGSLRITRMLSENGQTGADSGAGFYLHEEGRAGLPNPEATRSVQSLREDRGQKVGAREVQQYCLAVLANEAARMIADGAIRSPGELDLLATEEFGLAPELGGPLHAADTESLLHLRYLLTGKDGRETPHDALLDMIKNGLNFSALNAEAQRAS